MIKLSGTLATFCLPTQLACGLTPPFEFKPSITTPTIILDLPKIEITCKVVELQKQCKPL